VVAAVTRRTSIIVIGALAVSVALNIFALSFVAGRWSAGGERWNALSALLPFPAPIRAELQEALAERRREVLPALGRLNRARAAMLEIARAPELNATELEAAMAELRAATTAAQEIGHAALAEVLLEAAPEDRAAITPGRTLGIFRD
jgi:hypothetical protein